MRMIYRGALRFLSVVLFAGLMFEAVSPKLLALPGSAASAITEGFDAQAVLRLHVVANSDSHEDQRIKLLVRDALLKEFAPMESLEEAETVLLRHGGGVLEAVESVLREQRCGYGAQLRFGQMQFPDKTYGGRLYPAGSYEALRVELGDASGENWWCVLFPPICLVDIGVSDIPDSETLVFESDFLDFLLQNK